VNESREREFWTPEPIWLGRTCFLLGGGPSLTQADCDRLEGLPAMAINSSHLKAPWAPVLFFTDSGWYERHREVVRDWPGIVVSVSRTAKRELPDTVKRVEGIHSPDGFPPVGTPAIRQGRSSGHTGVSLAAALGANRIVLLGYDMRAVDGRTHHHDDYVHNGNDAEVYAREFVPMFAGWNAAALKSGIEIVNATPGSALTEFPFVTLDEILCEAS
jgi:hypothetical protein